MKIIITGGAGYLGSKIAKKLEEQQVDIVRTDYVEGENIVACDLSDKQQVGHLVEKYQPDNIIHCAAIVPQSMDAYANEEAADTNLAMLDHIIHAGAKRLLFISSMTVYGSNCPMPVQEQTTDAKPGYAMTKLEGEKQLEQSGMASIAVRLPGLFGAPRQGGLVYNAVMAARDGKIPQLPDAPLLWAAIHVEDAAMVIVKLAVKEYSGFQAVNVGYSGSQSINRFIGHLEKQFDYSIDCNIKHPDFEMNLSRLEKLGACPEHDFAKRCFDID